MKRIHLTTAALVALLMVLPIAEAQTGDSVISGRWRLVYKTDPGGEWYGSGLMILEWKVEDGKLTGKVIEPPVNQLDRYKVISILEALRGDKQIEAKPVTKSAWRLIEPQFDGTRLRFKIEHSEGEGGGVYTVAMHRKNVAFEGRWQIEGSVIKGTIEMIREDAANK